ncbi:hypothetical protein KIW84_035782 [Lathyrus oleraceus]|uniref:Uncharacterized protein n=1 Tax=Pisum sativum TaxID=3888 RepID=A0A9D4Y3M8_PEA|nr:hypothetical protein KIW84_035782 [Pisum sativum]
MPIQHSAVQGGHGMVMNWNAMDYAHGGLLGKCSAFAVLILFLVGAPRYRHFKPSGNPLARELEARKLNLEKLISTLEMTEGDVLGEAAAAEGAERQGEEGEADASPDDGTDDDADSESDD